MAIAASSTQLASKESVNYSSEGTGEELQFAFSMYSDKLTDKLTLAQQNDFEHLFESEKFSDMTLSEQVKAVYNLVKALPEAGQSMFKFKLEKHGDSNCRFRIESEDKTICWFKVDVAQKSDELIYLRMQLFSQCVEEKHSQNHEESFQAIVNNVIESDPYFPLSCLNDKKVVTQLSNIKVGDKNLFEYCLSNVRCHKASATAAVNIAEKKARLDGGVAKSSAENEWDNVFSDKALEPEVYERELAISDAGMLSYNVEALIKKTNDYANFERITIEQLVKDNPHLSEEILRQAMDSHEFSSDALVNLTLESSVKRNKFYRASFAAHNQNHDLTSVLIRNERLFLRQSFSETSDEQSVIYSNAAPEDRVISKTTLGSHEAFPQVNTGTAGAVLTKLKNGYGEQQSKDFQKACLIERRDEIMSGIGETSLSKYQEIELACIESQLQLVTELSEQRIIKSKPDKLGRSEGSTEQNTIRSEIRAFNYEERNLAGAGGIFKVQAYSLREFIQKFYQQQLNELVQNEISKSPKSLLTYLQQSAVIEQLKEVKVGKTDLARLCISVL